MLTYYQNKVYLSAFQQPESGIWNILNSFYRLDCINVIALNLIIFILRSIKKIHIVQNYLF